MLRSRDAPAPGGRGSSTYEYSVVGRVGTVERARYLLAAVDTGSLRAAAARCGVSQPTLGQQVALLEEELDVVLLIRGRHGVRLTPAAEDAIRESAMESSGAYHGRVRIGGVSVTAETITAPVVGDLRKHHPGLRFSVREGASADIRDLVWLPLRDAQPVTLCLTQRQDSQPSRAALIVRRLVQAKAGELSGS